jgi:hypothetical protein
MTVPDARACLPEHDRRSLRICNTCTVQGADQTARLTGAPSGHGDRRETCVCRRLLLSDSRDTSRLNQTTASAGRHPQTPKPSTTLLTDPTYQPMIFTYGQLCGCAISVVYPTDGCRACHEVTWAEIDAATFQS